MNVGIIGLGLIGGSLGLALKHAGKHKVLGYDSVADSASALCVDKSVQSIKQIAEEADLIVVAVPVGQMKSVFAEIGNCKAVLTDIGSVKQAIVQAAEEVYGEAPSNFVPGHPIAGSEQSGAAAAKVDLYRDQRVVLTPLEHTDPGALETVAGLWRGIGAQVDYLDVEDHDRIFALTSHLSHVLAYSLVNCLHAGKDQDQVPKYAASGFRDLTRIAASNPQLWSDICLSNRTHIVANLRHFCDELERLIDVMEAGDAEQLREIFSQANKYKEFLNGFNHKPKP